MAAMAELSLTLNLMGKCSKPLLACSGNHLGIPINLKNTMFVKDLPMISNWVPHKSMT
jgi:hypothetical protein